MDKSTPVIVSTTAESEEMLAQIADSLLEKRLAACCQISGPINSMYRWKGKVESSQEFVCSIKTMSGLIQKVSATIAEIHNYDEPEIVATEIVGGSDTYLKWIAESVTSEG